MMKTLILPLACLSISFCMSCKKAKTSDGGNGGMNNPPTSDSIFNQVDPANPTSIGFFNNGWSGRIFSYPSTTPGLIPSGAVTDSLSIDVNKVLVKVPSLMYGNNSNLWTGQMVTEPSLMQYITDLSPNIIRAPAGSVSDIYFWNGTDAAPAPADAPAELLNAAGQSAVAGYWYGGNKANWTFSLENYYNLLAQTHSTGMITVNYGYARYGTSANPVATAAHLAADWVRYDKGRTKYWEVGNETYGNWEAGYNIDVSKNKDGQPALVTGALYGQHVKVFTDSMHAAAKEIGATIYVGATLYDKPPASFEYTSIKTWNQGVLTMAGGAPDYYIVHDYFTAYNTNSTLSEILSTANTIPTEVMNYAKSQINAAGVPQKPIAMTEWNIQATGAKQNVSYIAGIHAAKTMGSMIKNQYGQASRWDFANAWDNGNDHGMFSLGDEPNAPKWNPRPAYYYLYYFQKFFGDRMVYDTLKSLNSDMTSYSSTFSSGEAGTVLINSGKYGHIVAVDFKHFPAGSEYYWFVLKGGTDNGDFSGQVYVNGTGPATATGGPLNYSTLSAYTAPLSGTIKVEVPPLSVVYLMAKKK